MDILAPDILADLPPEIHDDIRGVLSRIAAAGLPLERNPNMPSMVATRVDGTMFQITVLFNGGFPHRVAILGPGKPQTFGDPTAVPLTEWNREAFMALLPPPLAAPEPPPPIALRPLNFLPDERETLLEIRDLLVEIRNRLP
jgi:hypothetical protein